MSTHPHWSSILSHLETLVGKDEYLRWFEGLNAIDPGDGSLQILVPNAIHEFWIESNHERSLATATANAVGSVLDVSFAEAPEEEVAVAEKLEESSTAETEDEGTPQFPMFAESGSASDEEVNSGASPVSSEDGFTGRSVARGGSAFEKKLLNFGLNPLQSFDTFVTGENCEYAVALAQAVAEKPGKLYNPFFLHGGPGLGKTHLAQAIAQECLRLRPNSKVVYITSEQFTNEFIDSIKSGNLAKLRKRYRKADILVIDDINFFQAKDSTQDEFFHTFNELFNARKQIVMTSDTAPSELTRLEDRLVTRCDWGLTTEILPPNVETRVAILRKKMTDWNIELADEHVQYIAERVRSNVRLLEGALVRLGSYAALGKGELNSGTIDKLLADIFKKEGKKNVTIDQIQKKVAEFYDIRMADMVSKRRPKNIAEPRQIAMYLVREMTKTSLKDIGEAFGGRDHGTVLYAVGKVTKMMREDEGVAQDVSKLQGIIEQGR